MIDSRPVIAPGTREYIQRAAEILRSGGLVAFPTETVYGLGANALDATAVTKIFQAKGRPSNNPLIVHLAKPEHFSSVAVIEPGSRTAHWLSKLEDLFPGPLSVVLPSNGRVCAVATGGGSTVALRVPRHPVAQALLAAVEFPIAAPSANRSMQLSPTSAAHVAASLKDTIDLVIDGGPCDVGLESTVVSLCGEQPTLLRPGAVTLEMLEARLGPVVLPANCTHGNAPLPSPGLLKKHYAPSTTLKLRSQVMLDHLPPKAALVSFSTATSTALSSQFAHTIQISASGDLDTVAQRLFATLHELDAGGFDLIVVDECASEGLGRAITDRLSRASCTSE